MFTLIQVNANNKITIPKKYRKALRIEKGITLKCSFCNGKIILERLTNRWKEDNKKFQESIETLLGCKVIFE